MNQPLVSIALCTYNGEKFLRKQIDSLLAQTYPHIEVIVCDDASSDDTAGILNSYTDPGMVKYFNPENIGYIRNFEQAIRHCTGQYIAICDQDDVWRENKIERMLNSIDDAWLLFSDSELIDEQGLQLGKKLSDLRNLYNCNVLPAYVWSNCVWGHTILMDQRLIQHALPLPEGAKYDIWLGFTAACLGKIKYLPEAMSFYRQHSGSQTITLPLKPVARDPDKKYADYIEQLQWITCMKNFVTNPEQNFFNELYKLYQDHSGMGRVNLFGFLLKHRKKIFAFRNKSYVSQLNEIRKICRKVDVGKHSNNEHLSD